MLREDLALIVPHNDRETEGERNACPLTLLFATTYLTKVVNHSQKWLEDERKCWVFHNVQPTLL